MADLSEETALDLLRIVGYECMAEGELDSLSERFPQVDWPSVKSKLDAERTAKALMFFNLDPPKRKLFPI